MGRSCDIYSSPPPGSGQDALESLLGSSHLAHLYKQSVVTFGSSWVFLPTTTQLDFVVLVALPVN